MRKTEKLISQLSELKKRIRKNSSNAKDKTKKMISTAKEKTKNLFPQGLAFLSESEILKWTKELNLTNIKYDKALDAEYIKSNIGGGKHRMFDGGHDPISALEAVRNADPEDSLSQEVIGYVLALWNDSITPMGLPFVTWNKENFDECASWVNSNVPGASKDWVYDLMSFDAIEIASSSITVASAIFFLKKKDTEKLSEILGAMGILSITSANLLMGITLILITTYSYVIKKRELEGKKLITGATLAGTSAIIFSALSLPVLIELGVVIVTTNIIKQKVLTNEEVNELIKSKVSKINIPSKLNIEFLTQFNFSR